VIVCLVYIVAVRVFDWLAPLIWSVPDTEHGSWDHPGMLLSIIYAVVRRLLDTLTVVVRRDINEFSGDAA
jgi:hypothetical protein